MYKMKNQLQIIPQQTVKFKMQFFYTTILKCISSASHYLACSVRPPKKKIKNHTLTDENVAWFDTTSYTSNFTHL